MKAVLATGGTVALETLPDPDPEPNQLLVACLANGICGSDLRLLDSTKNQGPVAEPLILGHELCGEVVDFGPAVDTSVRRRLPVGSLVCLNPFISDREVVGLSPRHPGGMAEFATLDPARLLAVPPGLAPVLAALTEPLAVGVRAVGIAARRGPQGPFVIIGSGPIGLAVLVALRYSGYGPIITSDLSAYRRNLAEQLGADEIVAADSGSPLEALATHGFRPSPASPLLDDRESPGLGPTIFECTGRSGVLEDVLDNAPRHSHVVVVGVCHQPTTFTPGVAVAKELALDFVLAYRHGDLRESLARIADNPALVAPLVTATVRLERAKWSIEALRSSSQGKILVLPHGIDQLSVSPDGRTKL